MTKKKKTKGPRLTGTDIALAILAALGGSILFMTIVAVAGSIMFPDSGKRVTADQPPAASQVVQGTLPSKAPTSSPALAPTAPPVRQTQAPAQTGNQGGGASSITNEITGDLSRTAYWVDGGESYHFSRGCRSLARSTNIRKGTLQDALNAGKTDPCNNCAGGH